MRALDPLILATLLLQLVVPLALLGSLALGRRRNRVRVVLDATFVALYLAAIALAGLWLALPRWLVALFGLALLPAATAFALRRVGRRPEPSPALPWIRGLAVACAGAVLLHALLGRRPLPGDAVELAFPLEAGLYQVAAGGSNTLLNPHLGTLDAERARPYRGQSYALDLVGVGSWGSRKTPRLSPELEAFAAFGAAVHAPCDGTVVRASDGQPDGLAAGRPPESLEGNHLILACGTGEVWVVLAHLARGSVAVRTGEEVAAGDPLARVGNSGRSDEPHLHIHAQTPGTEAAPLGGDPLPMTFEGRRLVRNDRTHGRPKQTTSGPLGFAPARSSGLEITIIDPRRILS